MKTAIDNEENPHIIINKQYKNISQISTKEIYIELLKKQEIKPNCIDTWNVKLEANITEEQWENFSFVVSDNPRLASLLSQAGTLESGHLH